MVKVNGRKEKYKSMKGSSDGDSLGTCQLIH